MFFGLGSVALVAVFLAACSNPNVSHPDTITTAVDAPIQSLNPLYATDSASQHVNELVHASLVVINEHLIPEPYLAEEFHYEGTTTIAFRLRQGCKFPSGKEITSTDVEKTLAFFQDKRNESAFADTAFKNIQRFERIDDYRFRLHTAKPAPGLLSDLELLKILSLEGIQPGQKPISLEGAGPYKLTAMANGQIQLVRSGQPCLPVPPTPKIIVKSVRDDLSRYLKLKRGELDILLNEMNFRKVELIARDPSLPLRVLSREGIGYTYLGVNLESPRLRDRRVREALALSFDIPSVIRYKSRGMASPARNLLADQNFYANLSVPIKQRDLKRARELLHEAGYSNDENGKPVLRLTLKTNTNQISVENARVLVAQAKEAGIEIEHKAYEWGAFYNDVKTGNTELYLLRWVGVTDPRIYFETLHSGEIGRNNRTRYRNAEMDRLLVLGESTMDPLERKRIYAKVQELAAYDLPFLGLWYPKNVAVYRQELRDVSLHPKGSWKVFLKMRKE